MGHFIENLELGSGDGVLARIWLGRRESRPAVTLSLSGVDDAEQRL